MRSIVLAAIVGVACLPACAQTSEAPVGVYVLDRTHASVQWSVLHEGIAWYHARFTGFDIQLDFNPADVAKSKVTATIDPKSVETDFVKTRSDPSKGDFNALIYDRFFLAGQHPTISFVSTTIAKKGDNTGKMTGNLTFRGITKPITLDVTYVGKRQRGSLWRVGFSATGTIKRSDFGVATTAVADGVRIAIDGEFMEK
jgi:polyisoprenoid-binding protein YceI